METALIKEGMPVSEVQRLCDVHAAVFNTLPVDVTFVDKDGAVKFFTQGKERIFPRTKAVIGRQVSNCHPPASVHIVEKIVEDLSSGKKDYEDFWIKMKSKYVMIRYFAVRDKVGNFLGTLEFTQDIAPLRKILQEFLHGYKSYKQLQ